MVRSGLPEEVNDLTVEIAPENRDFPELEETVKDNLTAEQRKRDEDTTTLYRQFVEAHNAKQLFSRSSKKVIRACCIAWISVFIMACIGLSAYVIIGTERQSADVIALISVIIPLIVAIIGTLNIVTKYVFPENEERHITEIVKTILDNDLKNKIENVRNEKGRDNVLE